MPETSVYAGFLAFSFGCGNILVIKVSINLLKSYFNVNERDVRGD